MKKIALFILLFSFQGMAQTESSQLNNEVAPVNIVKVEMVSIPTEPKSKFDSEVSLKLIEKNCANLDLLKIEHETFNAGALSAFDLKCIKKKGANPLLINVNIVIKKVSFWEQNGELYSIIADNDESIITVINKLITLRSDSKNHINDLKNQETEDRLSKFLK